MSWDSHIQAMCSNNGCDDACIVSLADGSMWAGKGDFLSMRPDQAKLFIKAARGEALSDTEPLMVGTTKYMVVRVDGDICNMVSKNLPEKQLLCVGLSNQAATFGTKKGEGQKSVVGVVENEAKFLRDSGY